MTNAFKRSVTRDTGSFCRNALLVTASVAAFLAVIELILRVTSLGYLGIPVEGHPVLHHVNPANLEFSTYDLRGEVDETLVIYDEYGFRVPDRSHEYLKDKESVVFLGDSFVEASEVEYWDSFVGLFAKAHADKSVYNMGVTSYGPLLSYLQLKYHAKTVTPNLVYHLLYENDPADDERYYADATFQDDIAVAVSGKATNYFFNLLRHIYVARFLRRAQLTLMALIKPSSIPGQPRQTGDRLPRKSDTVALGEINKRYIKLISAYTLGLKARYVLLCVPSKTRFNDGVDDKNFCVDVKGFAAREGIDYIDLDAYFAGNTTAKPFYGRNIHFNKIGHRMVFSAIMDRSCGSKAAEAGQPEGGASDQPPCN